MVRNSWPISSSIASEVEMREDPVECNIFCVSCFVNVENLVVLVGFYDPPPHSPKNEGIMRVLGIYNRVTTLPILEIAYI